LVGLPSLLLERVSLGVAALLASLPSWLLVGASLASLGVARASLRAVRGYWAARRASWPSLLLPLLAGGRSRAVGR